MNYFNLGDIVKINYKGFNKGKYVKAITLGAIIETEQGLCAFQNGLYELDHHVEESEVLLRTI